MRPRSAAAAAARARVLSCLCAGLLAACAGSVPPPVQPASAPPLGPKEGFVILDVDTDVAVAEVVMDRFVAARNLPKGRHRWVVRLPAGRYRWIYVEFGSESGHRERYPVRNMVLSDAKRDPRDEFRFEVVAGAINYPGSAIIRTSDFGRSAALPIDFRIRNHSAMAVRRLLDTHAEIFEAYPVRYAGERGDTFLEHWESLRRRVARSGREGGGS